MAPLTIILAVIMVWCFYFRFMKAVMARRRLIWVEVLDQQNDFSITRYMAKQNLHLVGEVTQKLRSYNYLFDKYWYRQREILYIDAITNIEQQEFSNNQPKEGASKTNDDTSNDGTPRVTRNEVLIKERTNITMQSTTNLNSASVKKDMAMDQQSANFL